MSRPDNELIAEVILFSEGFKDAKSLGRKLVAVFNLSRLDKSRGGTLLIEMHLLSLSHG